MLFSHKNVHLLIDSWLMVQQYNISLQSHHRPFFMPVQTHTLSLLPILENTLKTTTSLAAAEQANENKTQDEVVVRA